MSEKIYKPVIWMIRLNINSIAGIDYSAGNKPDLNGTLFK
jgi:hypothetical protein